MFVTGAVVVTWLADEMTNYGIGGVLGVHSLKCAFAKVKKDSTEAYTFDAIFTVASHICRGEAFF